MRIIGCIYTLDNRRSRCWIPTPANCKTRPSNIRGEIVREFYSALSGPILVGIEATGSMQWFLELMEELGEATRSFILSLVATPGSFLYLRKPICQQRDRSRSDSVRGYNRESLAVGAYVI
jgi:hypothetical protein